MKTRHVFASVLLAPMMALSFAASASVEDPGARSAVLLKQQRDIMDAIEREKTDLALVQRHLGGSKRYARDNAIRGGSTQLAGVSIGRELCTRYRITGSHVKIRHCVTVVERKRLESDVVQFLLKNGN